MWNVGLSRHRMFAESSIPWLSNSNLLPPLPLPSISYYTCVRCCFLSAGWCVTSRATDNMYITLVLIARISDEKLVSRVTDAAFKTANTVSADVQILLSFVGIAPYVSSLYLSLVFVLFAYTADTILKHRVLALLLYIVRQPFGALAVIPRPAATGSSSDWPMFLRIRSCIAYYWHWRMERFRCWHFGFTSSRSWLEELRNVAHLFIYHERVRTCVLAYAFNVISDIASDSHGSIYARCLPQLDNNPNAHVIYRAHVATLTRWFPALTTIEFEKAGALANALTAIAASLSTVFDKLIRKLRGESSTVHACSPY